LAICNFLYGGDFVNVTITQEAKTYIKKQKAPYVIIHMIPEETSGG
jgi:hypothetical protein